MEHQYLMSIVDQDFQEEIDRMKKLDTNARILTNLLTDHQLRQKIWNLLQANPQQFATSALEFEIISEDPSPTILDMDDIADICQIFGPIASIDQCNLKIEVVFKNKIDCYIAQKILNEHTVHEQNITLIVKWIKADRVNLKEYSEKILPNYLIPHEFDEKTIKQATVIQNFDGEKQAQKYTCRYEILIENDKDFQVARKIIGSKGCNMKKIIDQCIGNSSQNVKLRLRGRGSGYKEGPSKQESNEPLHLCVSSKSHTMFEKTCGLVESLLLKIYSEYKQHYNQIGRKPQPNFYRKLTNTGNKVNQQQVQQYQSSMVYNQNRYDFPPLILTEKLIIR